MNSKNLASTSKGVSLGTAIHNPQRDCISPNRVSKKLLTKSKNKSEFKGLNNKMISKTKSIKKPILKSKNQDEASDETNPKKENVVPNKSISKSPNRMKSKSPNKKLKSIKIQVEIRKEEESKNEGTNQASNQNQPSTVVLEKKENPNVEAEQQPATVALPESNPNPVPAETTDVPAQPEVASIQIEVATSGQLPSVNVTIPEQAAMEIKEAKEIEPIPEQKPSSEQVPMNAPNDQDVEMKDITMSEIKPNPESNRQEPEKQENVPPKEEQKPSEAPISENPNDQATVSEPNPNNVPTNPEETSKNEGEQEEKKEEEKEQKSDAMMFT